MSNNREIQQTANLGLNKIADRFGTEQLLQYLNVNWDILDDILKDLGNLPELKTTVKDSLISAINENFDAIASFNKSQTDWKNVKKAGVTTLSQLQTFMNSLSEGDTVYFPSDFDMTCTSAVQVSVNNIRITGKGKLRLGSNNGYCLRILANDVVVDGIQFYNPSGLKLVDGTRSGAIEILGHNNVVTLTQIDGMLNGIVVNSGTATVEYKNTRIVNNKITNCLGAGREDLADAIFALGSETIVIGNYVTCKAGEDARIGINLESLEKETPITELDGNGTVVGNIILGSFRRGIHVECNNTTVMGNTTKGNTWWGIIAHGQNHIIKGNIVDAPKFKTPSVGATWNPTIAGIICMLGSGHIIEGNIISGGSDKGIHLKPEVSGSIIKGNIIRKHELTNDVFNDGIYLESSHGNTVEGNIIESGACGRGIVKYKCKNTITKGNRVTGCSSKGIFGSGDVGVVYHNLLEGNIIKNTVGRGVELSNMDYTKISDNLISDDQATKTQTDGLYLWNCNYFTATDNDLSGNSGQALNKNASANGIIKDNRGYVSRNGGLATFNGDGTITTFTIPHGLATTPTKVFVTANSADAVGAYVTFTATNIVATYKTAPVAGTGNVKLLWTADFE